MDILELEIQQREEIGKGYAKKVRKQGLVPAVVYGKKKEPILIKLDVKQVEKVLKSQSGENSLLSLKFVSNGAEKIIAMIQEIQREILRPDIIHVDFKRISLEEKTTVMVPINIISEPKDAGGKGMLEHLLWEVEVECLPLNIPKTIDVDISDIKLGEAITVSDLKVPEGIKILTDPTDAVLLYSETREEKPEEAEDALLFPAERSEPEVIGRKREEEE